MSTDTSTGTQPNPPARRDEDFPKTTTIPEGWITDALMDFYNSEVVPESVLSTPARSIGHNGKVNGKTQAEPVDPPTQAQAEQDSLFSRRLEPYPSTWDLTGAYL